METARKISRREQILQALAEMLEQAPGERITTSGLARQVGVSEAALYRHFPSKAKMFEGLIQFIEDSIFTRINKILSDEPGARERIETIIGLLLAFAERNPGISRILAGDALAGETERLRSRILQFFDRLETQLRQVLREAEVRENLHPVMPVTAAASLLLAVAEGHISQFVRSEFRDQPTRYWDAQRQFLIKGLFRAADPGC